MCFALDRSGSMGFDMSGVDWSYPSNNPLLSSFSSWGWTWQNNLSPPHPTESRWAILADAVRLFMTEAGQFDPQPRVAMVTWANEYTMPISPYTDYPTSSLDVPLPSRGTLHWDKNVDDIDAALDSWSAQPVMGGTNLAAGIDHAATVLTHPDTSRLSSKYIILLTDGQWNNGRDPLEAAADALANNLIIHTISMNGGSAATCQEIANMTGGQYFSANSPAELSAAFQELARTLPVMLTE